MLKKFLKGWFIYLFITLYCYVASDSVVNYLEIWNYNATCKPGKEVKHQYENIWAHTIRNIKKICEIW